MNRYREKFEDAVAFVLGEEGDRYSDHPKDRGGPTKYGITQRTLNDATGLVPVSKVHELTRPHAVTIYHERFWRKIKGDELPPRTGLVLMDWYVNSGLPPCWRFSD